MASVRAGNRAGNTNKIYHSLMLLPETVLYYSYWQDATLNMVATEVRLWPLKQPSDMMAHPAPSARGSVSEKFLACPPSIMLRSRAYKRKVLVSVLPPAPPAIAPAISALEPALAETATALFCNLNPQTCQHEPGSVWGGALLVAGTTVGAGILALPAVTQVPSVGPREPPDST